MPHLSFVNDIKDIRESIVAFNNSMMPNREIAISIAKLATYWVFDPFTNKYGPAKFVGFSNMNFKTYEIARKDNNTGDSFDGGATRIEIEKITGSSFRKSSRLESELKEWISAHLGLNILENVNTSKWKFITLSSPYNYWALMADPDIYRIEDAIKELDGDSWTVEKADINKGDKCIIWKAKGKDTNRGIIAFADVLSNPAIMDEPPEAKKYRKIEEDDLPRRRVRIKYIDSASLPIWLEEDKTGILKSLSVSKAKGGSVFKITPVQWSKLSQLIYSHEPIHDITNRVLLKTVGKSQHQDGVRINKDFHDIFNPPGNPYYVAKGQSREISVNFNNKIFKAKYVYEGTKADRDLQRIQFSRNLLDEFKSVFPNAAGFFRIKLDPDINNFKFLFDTQDAYEFNSKLEDEVTKSRSGNREERQKRLLNAQSKPDTVQVTSVAYIRNPDVIAEVLERSNGVCENCRSDAPFLRRKDNTPFLEVHHKIPLSDGGYDTVDNAIACCPNCHRELHFG